MTHRVHIVDSHTGGEPTRTVISGGPELGQGSLAERAARFLSNGADFRSALINEPRGHAAIVGALLVEPSDETCATGVIFFNNVGVLGMCGHGAIGVVETLRYLGRAQPGTLRLETPAGVVDAELHAGHSVTIANVASYRHSAGVTVDVEGFGTVRGDVAYGGNWFFLTGDAPCPLAFEHVEELTAFAWRLRLALNRAGVEVDHIEICGPADARFADGRNFVLCPGKEYDRSPCGTGTSAKLACLIADAKLAPGQVWRQQSITGSVFEATAELRDGRLYPRIKGRAYVTSEARLVLDESDPFVWGIKPR